MVSFIYRGGTKKVARDQAVTYLVCHRSGHYKPTMSSETPRKRKLKPQGSCKMGGYCTAGIKLMKNIETGIVKMEICHSHYGHPLDSDAIPHLRVRLIYKTTKSFPGKSAYRIFSMKYFTGHSYFAKGHSNKI